MFIIIFLYIVLPLIQIYLFSSEQFGVTITDTLNFCSSILSLHWLLANIIISAKLPLLQKSIPYAKRIRFHILSSFGITLTILYHTIYKLALEYDLTPITWALLVIFSLMIVCAVLWIPTPGLKNFRIRIIKKVRNGAAFDYGQSKALHKILVLIIGILLLLHIIETDLFDNVNQISSIMYVMLYIGSFGTFLLSTILNRDK